MRRLSALLLTAVAACTAEGTAQPEAGIRDTGVTDRALPDADAGAADADTPEAGTDAQAGDAEIDAGAADVGNADAGREDAGPPDAAPVDTGPAVDGGAADLHSVEMDRDFTNVDGEDEITIICDDAVPGAGGHQPCDVGAGSFTYEVWMRGDAAANPNSSGIPLDVERVSYDWIQGNIFLDRDIYGGSCDGRDFGASVIDGRVSFGVGATLGGSGPLTVYGSTPVVETPSVWRHVALVYDNGRLRVFVDGVLDVESATVLPPDDRSIPDEGCSQGSASSPARQVELAVGTEKHGFGAISFDGRIGRVRIWDVARTDAQIAAAWSSVVPCSSAGLVARYDLETGNGPVEADACGRSPDAIVALGSRGLTRWVQDGPALTP